MRHVIVHEEALKNDFSRIFHNTDFVTQSKLSLGFLFDYITKIYRQLKTKH